MALHEHQYLLIRQSKAFIEKYLAEKIELENMAAMAPMPRFHYIRVFHRVSGLRPRQFFARSAHQQSQGAAQIRPGRHARLSRHRLFRCLNRLKHAVGPLLRDFFAFGSCVVQAVPARIRFDIGA